MLSREKCNGRRFVLRRPWECGRARKDDVATKEECWLDFELEVSEVRAIKVKEGSANVETGNRGNCDRVGGGKQAALLCGRTYSSR